jgi:VCBS repeat-containing protein
MLSANDENGDTLTFSLDQEPMLGMVTIDSNGSFTYQPNAEVTGSDSFTFTASDGINFPVSGTINITIEALEVSFASYSRAAFSQQSSDKPLAVNGRAFIQDVEEPAAYDDLIQQ